MLEGLVFFRPEIDLVVYTGRAAFGALVKGLHSRNQATTLMLTTLGAYRRARRVVAALSYATS